MKCPTCKSKGYIKNTILHGDNAQSSYSKCHNPDCKHTHNYYTFIKARYASEPKDNVIQVDFKNRKLVEKT